LFDDFTADLIFALIDIWGCAGNPLDPNTWLSCLNALVGTAHILSNLDFNLITLKTPQINEAIRRIDGDGMTIIPRDLLERLLELGIEVHHGRTPPNITGSFFVSPVVLVRSNFADGLWPGHQFADLTITFSNQSNTRMTVDVSYFQAQQTGRGEGFITGNGNKFSVFLDTIGTFHGHPTRTVDIWSGEITPTGILNYYHAFIMTEDAPGTVRRGQGRLFYDRDGFSPRLPSGLPSIENDNESPSGVLLPSIHSSGN
jgi:hypothetical protein